MEDRHVAVLLEEMRGQFKVFGEALQSTSAQLNERLDGVDKRLDGVDKRLDGVDKRLDGVDKRLGGIDHRLDGLTGDMRDVKARLTRVERAVTNGTGYARKKKS